jgi:hypothetical protein
MGWLNGIFSRVHDWTDDEAAGVNILSTRHDEEDDNFETGINACLAKDGTNSPSANLPMGGMVHTGVGTGAERDSYASIAQVQDGAFKYNSAFNNLNAYTLVLSPAPTGYSAGQQFNFKPANSNSGATTLSVNGLGPKNVYANGAPCTGGEIVGGRIYSVIYDGTRFHLVSGGSGGGNSLGGAKICMSSHQHIVNSTVTVVTFRTELYDDSAYYTAGNSGLTIPATGRYRVSTGIWFVGPSSDLGETTLTGWFAINNVIREETASVHAVPALYTAAPYYVSPNFSMTWDVQLTVNDIVTVKIAHTNVTGEARDVQGSGTEVNSSWLAIERIK